jgi:hypothetical protein
VRLIIHNTIPFEVVQLIKGDPNEEIQFLGAVLVVALVLGAIGFAFTDVDSTARSYAALQKMYGPIDKLPGFCMKQGDDSIYVRNTVEYRDFNGDRQKVTDFCRNYNGKTLVEYGCHGDNLKSTDIYCPEGCSNGVCNSRYVAAS